MSKTDTRPVAGVLWMIFTGLNFVAVTAIVKYIGQDIPAAQAAFMRYFLGLVFLLPFLGEIRANRLTKRAFRLFAMRGVFHTAAVFLWFFAMARISIAEVTAMNYLAPVYVSILAAFLLGEKLAARRITAIAVALLGALLILRPGFRELSPGHIAMLFTALLFSGSYLIAKIMADEVSPTIVVAWLSIMVTIGLAPFAAIVWVTPTFEQVGWTFLIACFATMGHYSMTFAFRAAPVTVTQPVTFLQLVWAVLLGYLVFNEGLDGWVILGGCVIVSAVIFITWREAVLKRQITPTVNATKT